MALGVIRSFFFFFKYMFFSLDDVVCVYVEYTLHTVFSCPLMNSNDLWPRLKGCFCVCSTQSCHTSRWTYIIPVHAWTIIYVTKQNTYDSCCDGAYDHVRRRSVFTVFIVPFSFPFCLGWDVLRYWTIEDVFFFFFGVLFYEMISVWMLVLWSGDWLIYTHTCRRTNPVLHTHITTLRNDINKILRELEFLPLWLLLQCRVFYCQTFTKHQQTSRLSAELDMNDRIYFKHLKYSSGYIIFEWNH